MDGGAGDQCIAWLQAALDEFGPAIVRETALDDDRRESSALVAPDLMRFAARRLGDRRAAGRRLVALADRLETSLGGRNESALFGIRTAFARRNPPKMTSAVMPGRRRSSMFGTSTMAV